MGPVLFRFSARRSHQDVIFSNYLSLFGKPCHPPLLHKMVSLFKYVHESQFIQFYFLSLSKFHQMKKKIS